MQSPSPQAKQPKPTQLFLFECTEERMPDGSFKITPKKVEIDRDIDADQAAKRLAPMTKRQVIRLAKAGYFPGAWQMPTDRGNGKWWMPLNSVLAFKPRMRERV